MPEFCIGGRKYRQSRVERRKKKKYNNAEQPDYRHQATKATSPTLKLRSFTRHENKNNDTRLSDRKMKQPRLQIHDNEPSNL